uniref:Uncharacterized protein n=1 Tax=Chromera velia CCMP2878 TaxID=1169474 RepID=A0A0G4FQ48_9ALVE|eukprot:Cvel_18216.t1-p1 / transcript=Cvel_18216.t1 / gene=Cvel_18216 / organism=Chromera_velia_CCMP2878 / gene_product=Serine/threonine-protein phosphatase 6 regulatory, putative / transcript_product=Serine/threonine-protein phosphatase 6 regulatory, putative / location=Cvel_scaffold1496:27973-28548(+) / protein_length=192 / sequence_SO=supercontig / SO=protein_coding / is_pseudo=false
MNAVDDDEMSALTCAVRGNQREVVRLLVSRGADVNHENSFRYDWRRDFDDHDAVWALSPLHQIAHGIYELDDDQNPMQPDLEIAQVLVAAGADVNAVASDNTSPLHMASQYAAPDMVEFLLNNGANIHLVDVQGATALHLACAQPGQWADTHPNDYHSNLVKTARLLLARSIESDVGAMDNNDRNALFWASE